MLLSKKVFIEAIEKLQKMWEAEQKLYECSDSMIHLFEWKPYSELIDMYVKVLENSLGVEIDDRLGSVISYFIYDLDFGKDYKPGSYIDNGKDIDLSTAEKLYEYILTRAIF